MARKLTVKILVVSAFLFTCLSACIFFFFSPFLFVSLRFALPIILIVGLPVYLSASVCHFDPTSLFPSPLLFLPHSLSAYLYVFLSFAPLCLFVSLSVYSLLISRLSHCPFVHLSVSPPFLSNEVDCLILAGMNIH